MYLFMQILVVKCTYVIIFVCVLHFSRYWQNNMNNVKANKSAHKESVRDLR